MIEEGNAHGHNQSIIYNSDIIDLIIDVIEHGEQDPDVLIACWAFLHAMARGNHIVQNQLYSHLDTLMASKGSGDGWQNDMTHLIQELFTNNWELVLGIRPHQIEKVVELLVEFTLDVPGCMSACRAIVKVEEHNLVVRQNQSLVIKYVMQHRAAILDVALMDSKDGRTRLLHSKSTVRFEVCLLA